jgi:hypothetical protein
MYLFSSIIAHTTSPIMIQGAQEGKVLCSSWAKFKKKTKMKHRVRNFLNKLKLFYSRVKGEKDGVNKSQFWIVQRVIRNKGQSSIAGGNGNYNWQILPPANTSLLTGWLKPTGGENSSIPPGQIASLTFLFLLPVSLDPNNCQIEFTDSDNQIFIGNLTYNEKPVNYYNWDTQSVLSSYISPVCPHNS